MNIESGNSSFNYPNGLSYFSYFDFGISSAVTFLFVKAFPSLLLIGDHRVTFYLVEDLCLNLGLNRRANREFAVGVNQQYLQVNLITGVARQMGHE